MAWRMRLAAVGLSSVTTGEGREDPSAAAGDELDVGFAVEAGVFEPLVVGLPLGGGEVLLEDLDADGRW